MSDIKRVVLYIRVSTEEQAQHGLSLDAQRSALTAYAAKQGYKVIAVYADEGISARKKYRRRPEFVRMLNDAKTKQFEIILFTKLDRWFRSVSDYYEVQTILDSCNVQWEAIEEQYDTTTANGRLNLNIKLAIAQDEADRTSERIKYVLKDKRNRGEYTSGSISIGYKVENKKLVIDPEKADIVRAAFSHYIVHKSSLALRHWLLDEHGIHMHVASIRNMLSRKTYIGECGTLGITCEPLISREVFETVQSIRKQRAGRAGTRLPDSVYLFSGLVFCAKCGKKMTLHVCKVHAVRYTYYRCEPDGFGRHCGSKMANEKNIEAWLIANMVSVIEEYNIALRSAKAVPPQKTDTLKIRKKMTKLKDLYLNDLIDRSEYEQDYNALKQQLDVIPHIPASKPIDLEQFRAEMQAYENLDNAHRKALWAHLIDKIVIEDGKKMKVFPRQNLMG